MKIGMFLNGCGCFVGVAGSAALALPLLCSILAGGDSSGLLRGDLDSCSIVAIIWDIAFALASSLFSFSAAAMFRFCRCSSTSRI